MKLFLDEPLAPQGCLSHGAGKVRTVVFPGSSASIRSRSRRGQRESDIELQVLRFSLPKRRITICKNVVEQGEGKSGRSSE